MGLIGRLYAVLVPVPKRPTNVGSSHNNYLRSYGAGVRNNKKSKFQLHLCSLSAIFNTFWVFNVESLLMIAV
jgi:hypothetical protein